MYNCYTALNGRKFCHPFKTVSDEKRNCNMRKNISKIILCVALAAMFSLFATGCSLFEHNYEKDYRQVVATIAAYEADYNVEDANGNVLETLHFSVPEKKIYKTRLIAMVQNYSSSTGLSDPEQIVDYLLNQLIRRELLITEADKMIEFKQLDWTLKDKNTVTESVYNTLDSVIKERINSVYSDHGEPVPSTGSGETPSTKYPVPEEETRDEEEDDETEVEKWVPDKSAYPALSGDKDKRSREREAMRRLVDYFENLIENDILATDAEKAYFEADIKKMRNLIAENREHDIYPMLYDIDYNPENGEGNGTYIVEYFYGKDAKDNQKIARLQEYATDGVSVTEEEILEQYNVTVREQKRTYASDSEYKTAMTTDTTDVLYTPNDNYFYVKHILIPFSAEQTAELTAYKNEGYHTSEQIENRRAQLAQEIVSYPHVNGEDDLSRPMSINAIFADIKSQMSTYKYNPEMAERTFDSLTYKYNTDSGAFGSNYGYAVRRELNGDTETYMKEFAAAARRMYDEIEVGQLFDEFIVTDYGVHIMYLASKTKAGEVKALNDYLTPANRKTVRDVIKKTALDSKEKEAFNTMQENIFKYYEDELNAVEKFEKRYKELYS